MTVEKVRIVNPNGSIATVPVTYPPLVAGTVRRLPSERGGDETPAGDEIPSLPDPFPTDTPPTQGEDGLSSDEANHHRDVPVADPKSEED